ncbi:TPA: ABC transporter permease, partial [Streptococcus pneumoniae]
MIKLEFLKQKKSILWFVLIFPIILNA